MHADSVLISCVYAAKSRPQTTRGLITLDKLGEETEIVSTGAIGRLAVANRADGLAVTGGFIALCVFWTPWKRFRAFPEATKRVALAQ